MENNFDFCLYTDVAFGRGAEKRIAEKLRQHGGSRVLLVYGGGSVKRSGLYDTVTGILEENGIFYVDFGDVKPNPHLEKVSEGVALVKENKLDFLVALGGGSSIDTAKAIGLAVNNPDVDIWQEYYVKKQVPKNGMLPVGVISTMAATGSEMSRSSVLRDHKSGVKMGFMLACARPTFALLNPELLYSVPKHQKACGCADIFAHAFERYFNCGKSAIADGMGEAVMRTVVENSLAMIQDPTDYDAHSQIMLCASFAHNDVTGLGYPNIVNEGSCHGIEVQMGGLYNTTHGEGLSLVMPAWMAYTMKFGDLEKHLSLAKNVFRVPEDFGSDEEIVQEGLKRMRQWFRQMGLASNMREMGMDEGCVEKLVNATLAPGAKLGKRFHLDREDLRAIYTSIY